MASRMSALSCAAGLIAASGLAALPAGPVAAAEPPAIPPWMKVPGAGMSGYGKPSPFSDSTSGTAVSAATPASSGGRFD